MADHRAVLDAFADARRTWDDLVTLQPDIVAAGAQLSATGLAELERRVNAHRETVDLLATALENESVDEQHAPR